MKKEIDLSLPDHCDLIAIKHEGKWWKGSTNGQICMVSTHLKNLYRWATHVCIQIHDYTYIHDMRIILLQKRTLHHHHHRNIWWHSVIAQKIRFTNLAGSCAIYFDAGVETSEHKNTNSNSSKRCQLDILLCMFCTSVIYILPTFKFPKWAPSGDDGDGEIPQRSRHTWRAKPSCSRQLWSLESLSFMHFGPCWCTFSSHILDVAGKTWNCSYQKVAEVSQVFSKLHPIVTAAWLLLFTEQRSFSSIHRSTSTTRSKWTMRSFAPESTRKNLATNKFSLVGG